MTDESTPDDETNPEAGPETGLATGIEAGAGTGSENQPDTAGTDTGDPDAPAARPLGEVEGRNLMRHAILDVARLVELDTLSPEEIVTRLRDIAALDAAALDSDDIDIDFDPGPLLTSPRTAGPAAAPDPVEEALSRTLLLRDRVHGLQIVGDTPGATDRAAYQDSLRALLTALAARYG